MIPKEMLCAITQNLAYVGMVCSVSLKKVRKLDKWRTKKYRQT